MTGWRPLLPGAMGRPTDAGEGRISMPNGSSWRNATRQLVSRLSHKDKILVGIAAAVTVITTPLALVELSRGNYATGLILAGAPILPAFRSSEILYDALRQSRTYG
jgi:hypothetical protein